MIIKPSFLSKKRMYKKDCNFIKIKPDLSVLPRAQRELFSELKDTPPHFVLCGGTAIALRMGHRISIDFDFFSKESFDPDKLYKQILYLQNSEILQKEPNTLTCLINRNEPVKVSFFGGLSLDYIYKAEVLEEGEIKIASLLDLAGMKVAVVQKRAASRDYIDIETLMIQGGIDLETMLAAGSIIYGTQFNPQITLKALVYFKEEGLADLPQKVKNNIINAVRDLKLEKIPERIHELLKIKENEKC
jgi:hypothetical protein